MKPKCAVLWLFLMYNFQPLLGLVCQPDLLSDGNSVITLSDELSDANTAEERCEELGGYLVVTRDAEVKQIVTDGAKSKYSGDFQRIWIYYDVEHPNGTDIYKYTLSPDPSEYKWFSPKIYDQTWYIDLYNSSSDTASNPISFCRSIGIFETWLVEDSGVGCSPGWELVFKFYSTYSTTDPRFKEIFKYYSLVPMTDRLTATNEPFRTSISERGKFRAPVTDVLIGARFNPTKNMWYWNDGVEAPEFADRGYSTCEQKVWSHLVNEELTTNCNQTTSFYSCQTIFSFNVTKFECNSTVLDISWNLMPLSLYYSKTLTVHIVATNDAVNSTTLTVTDTNSTILSGLTPRLNYAVTITASLGCDDITNVTSLQQVQMGPGIPDEIINAHVIKSGESCQMNFANPLPGEQFNFTIGIRAVHTGKTLYLDSTSEYCDDSFCQLPIDMSEFVGLGELRFLISAYNCEGSTEPNQVAGNCINPGPPKVCEPSLESRGDWIFSLSDSLASPAEAASNCSSLGGALARFNESQLSKELYGDLTDKYLLDIQRVWIYRMKSDNQTFKYSFSDTPGDDWEAPTESDDLTYVDLYNRIISDRDVLHFCDAKQTAEKWDVRTTSCNKLDWQIQFSLYGKTSPADVLKKIWLFASAPTGSVKLTSSDSVGPDFHYRGVFYVPDIHVHIGEITSADPLCPTVQYKDSWTTLTNCTDDPAYYACSLPFLTKVESLDCNSSVLIVSWEDNLSGLQRNVPYLTILKVVIRNPFENYFTKIEAQYSDLSVTIYDFPQRAEVNIEVELVFEGCFNEPVYSNFVGKTSYGLADPVTDTKIENPTTTCTIVMPPDESGNLLSYTVVSESENNSTYHDYDLTVHEAGLSHRMNISMEKHGVDTQINLKIRATTCEGTNEWTSVPGYCMVEGPEPFPTAVVVGSICGGLAAIGLLVGACYCCRRKKKEKDATKESEPEEVIGNKGAIHLQLPATTTTVEHF